MSAKIDWLHHESITRAATNTATGYIPSVKKTNADRIRNMTDEELARWIHQTRHNPLEDRNYREWLEWLKQEVDE